MIRLSERLQAVAHQVEHAGVVADIGCDHGLTSIYLVEQGLAEYVIAMDIHKGPLKRAQENIARHQMQHRIETRLSDGGRELVPGEAHTLLISGMGGGLICHILEDSPAVVQEARELVLSPQSELHLVRHFLLEHGFAIDREEMLQDQGKYYVILHAVPGVMCFDREEEYLFGRFLLQHKDACLVSFLQKERQRLKQILTNMVKSDLSPAGVIQCQELKQRLAQVEWSLGQCQRGEDMVT